MGEGLGGQFDRDEFRFAARGLRRASDDVLRHAEEVLRGTLYTPSGDCIPTFVTLHPARSGSSYSHVGRLDIPCDWLDEFAAAMRRFYFRSEHGEYFTQLQVVEDMAPDHDIPDYKARIILMRSRADRRPH